MFRSECGPIPVSTIATSASTRSSSPLIFDRGEDVAPTRGTPVGIVWAATSITSSGTTATTLGSASSAARWALSRRAVKPRNACLKDRSATMPSRVRCVLRTLVGSASPASMTMYRPAAIGRPFESTDGGADLVVPFGRGVAGAFGGAGVAGSPAVGAGSADTSGVASGDGADDVGSGTAVVAGAGGVEGSGLAAGSTVGVGSAADTGD